MPDTMHQSDHDIRNRLLIARLPAMPQILIKLITHLQADDAGMPELAALIAKDAGMTSKILGVANSSAYHRQSKVVSLEQSLVSLGTDMIKTLVISESVFQTFNSFPHSGSTDLRAFWKSSLSAAVMARALAKAMAYPHVEEAYLAGLLHNVGRLALLATAPKEYAFNFTARDDAALCAVEQRTLQITHAEAGAWLIERWQLDSFLADSVLYHHEPLARLEASHPLIRIVRLAHLLCCHADDAESIAQAAQFCALELELLDKLAGGVARQVAQAAQHLGIDLTGADDIATPPAYAAPPVDPGQQGESSLLEAITRSARILFDFDTAIILLQNATGHALVGVAAGEHQQRLAGFSIPLAKGGPLAAAALECQPAFLKRDMPALGIVEEQLFRILGTDSLVCMPLVVGQRSLGVLIGGVAGWQIAVCQKREGFLRAYANQAATALETAVHARGLARRQLDHVAEEYRAASRRVVHEVNNPLSIIKNYLSVLDHKLEKQEPVSSEMAILNEEIDRVGQLIGGLADLLPATASGVTDCARVVDDVLRLFRATDFLPPKIEVVTRMQDAPCEVEADADMLKQILLNLLKNAVEALPDGGRIEVANRGHVNRDRRLYLELCISDNGAGLAPEVLANLFSPVRSSKEGAHHGLGLSIVHDLVTRLHGVIGCRSSKSGTSFEILLPIPVPASAAAALPAPGNTALSS